MYMFNMVFECCIVHLRKINCKNYINDMKLKNTKLVLFYNGSNKTVYYFGLGQNMSKEYLENRRRFSLRNQYCVKD